MSNKAFIVTAALFLAAIAAVLAFAISQGTSEDVECVRIGSQACVPVEK